MLAPWYFVLPVVLLPLALRAPGFRSAWLFAAAAAGFALLALADWLAMTGRLGGLQLPPYLQDSYYVVAHPNYSFAVAGVFCVLAVVQWLKQRFDREDSRWTRGLFWILVLSVIGTRLVEMLAIPFAMPRRYADASTDFRAWMEASRMLRFVSVAAFFGLIGLMVVLPLWRRTAGPRGGR